MNDSMTIEEFQLILEREYIQFAICYNIFHERYKDKYLDKMEGHIAKIKDISDRLESKNMFTDAAILAMHMDAIIPEVGNVKFVYRTDEASKFDMVVKLAMYPADGEITLIDDTGFSKHTIVRNLANMNQLVIRDTETNATKQVSYDNCYCRVNYQEILELITELSK